MLIDLLGDVYVSGALLAFIGTYYFFLHPLYIAPLSEVPGPWISAITKYWILYKTWAEQRNRLVHKLHQEYGPIVRLAPNEISVSDPEYIKSIYIGNYDKSPFYGQFGAYGKLNTFSTLTRKDHLQRRKIMNKVYSKSAICSPGIEGITQDRVKDTMNVIANSGFSIDVYNLFHALAMDTVTNFLLGESKGTSFLRDQNWWMILNYRLQSAMWFWTTLMPRFYRLAADSETKNAIAVIGDWIKKLASAREKSIEVDSVIFHLNSHGISGLDACSEIQDHTAAGHETTGVTLSYLTYHLSFHEDVQSKLQQELALAFKKHESLSYNIVDRLPYLNGIVYETLRLYSAIPGAEPRIVPKYGLKWSEDLIIPGGIIVSIQPWTIHRDANIYENPLDFNPERWINQSPETLAKMKKYLMSFGVGVRMCIGMHLALQEIKLVIANIYLNYRTTLPPDFDHDKMYMSDKYTTHPQGHECILQFEKIKV